MKQIAQIPRGIQDEKSSKDMASSRFLVSTIRAQASPQKGDRTRCPEGWAFPATPWTHQSFSRQTIRNNKTILSLRKSITEITYSELAQQFQDNAFLIKTFYREYFTQCHVRLFCVISICFYEKFVLILCWGTITNFHRAGFSLLRALSVHMVINAIHWKRKDLTQSYNKSPYTHSKK